MFTIIVEGSELLLKTYKQMDFQRKCYLYMVMFVYSANSNLA